MVKYQIIPVQKTAVLQGENYTNPWYIFFEDIWRKTGKASPIKIGGVLSTNTTSVGNVGAGEDDLITYSMDRDTSRNDGDIIEVIAYGTFAANANNKEVKMYFGSTEIFATGANAINDGSWVIKATITRTDSDAQQIITDGNSNSSLARNATYTSGTEDFTTALTIKCTGEATANDDIVQQGLIVKFYPNIP